MRTRRFPTTQIGRMAIATGVSTILALVLLILMYTVNMSFGKINDVFNSIVGLSSAILAWMSHMEHDSRSPFMRRITLALAVVGSIFTVIGSILIIFDFTGFLLAGWYSGVGFALIGTWLVLFCSSLFHDDVLPQRMIIFGIVTGVFMGVGLFGIPGTFAGIDSMERMPWYLYVAFFGWFGTYILYPIWTIWSGRNLLLKSKHER